MNHCKDCKWLKDKPRVVIGNSEFFVNGWACINPKVYNGIFTSANNLSLLITSYIGIDVFGCTLWEQTEVKNERLD